jgi:hypothetical protein
MGPLRPVCDLGGRRGVPAYRQVDPDLAATAHGARPVRRPVRTHPGRADPGDPAGAGRPALQRRHRHLRQGQGRERAGRRRQGQ